MACGKSGRDYWLEVPTLCYELLDPGTYEPDDLRHTVACERGSVTTRTSAQLPSNGNSRVRLPVAA